MFLNGIQALHVVPQDGAAVEEVGQGDVDGSTCDENKMCKGGGGGPVGLRAPYPLGRS